MATLTRKDRRRTCPGVFYVVAVAFGDVAYITSLEVERSRLRSPVGQH